MARYEITGPDGAKYEVTAPDSATEAEVLAYAKQKFGSVAAAKFDPEGDGYDYDTATSAGLSADETGHWPSRDPRTGMLLKGRKHPTWKLTEESEKRGNYVISKGDDGRYYSKPSINMATLDERQEQRAALEKQMATLERQIQDLEEARGGVTGEYQAQLDDSIATLRRQQKALAAQIDRTGVGSTGNKVGSTIGSIVGGLGGAAAGSMTANPAGTVAGGVAGSAAGAAIGGAVGSKWDLKKAEPVTEEEATQLITSRAVDDVLWDVGGNALFIVGGKALKLAITPGLKERLRAALAGEKVAKRVGVATKMRVAAVEASMNPTITGRETAEEARQAVAREKAVTELADRGRGWIPTEGQIRGKAGIGERVSRSLQADKFKEQGAGVEQAAKSLHEDTVRPYGQPDREELGGLVLRQAERVENAVKNRTRPVFEEARNAGFEVDVTPVVQHIERILAQDAQSAGSALKPGERTWLQNKLRDITQMNADEFPTILGPDGKPMAPSDPKLRMSAGGVFDFISGNKRDARALTADGVPSKFFTEQLGTLSELADRSYLEALRKTGDGNLNKRLLAARNDYHGMMDAVYDGAVQQALKKNPEDVGRLFWQNGNVTEVKQLQNMIQLGMKEGTIDKASAEALNEGMLRGFLAEAVPDITAAAKWSQTLARDPLKRDTYAALKNAPGMEKLDDGMRVLEQAAQIALTKNSDLAFSGSGMISNLPARIGIGLSLGFIGPGAVAMFAGAEVWARMMATALAKKDAGAYRNILMVLRASSSDNPKVAAAARPAATSLIKWVKDLNDPELEAQIDFGEQQETQ